LPEPAAYSSARPFCAEIGMTLVIILLTDAHPEAGGWAGKLGARPDAPQSCGLRAGTRPRTAPRVLGHICKSIWSPEVSPPRRFPRSEFPPLLNWSKVKAFGGGMVTMVGWPALHHYRDHTSFPSSSQLPPIAPPGFRRTHF